MTLQQPEAAQRSLRYMALWRALGWLMIATLVVIMAVPTPATSLQIDYADKLVHVAAFGVLGAWTSQLYRPSAALAWRGVGLIGFGALTELMQVVIPWRSGDLLDLLANAVGVALGLALAPTPLGRTLQWLERQLAS